MWGKASSRSGEHRTRGAAAAAVALLSVRVARERAAIARFNDTVERELLSQVPPAALRALQVALDELLTNVVMHADQAAGPIEVEIARERDALSTTISYIAEAFDPTAWKSDGRQRSVASAAIGGLGIQLVRSLMDDFQYAYSDGRNVVSLRKRC
jgi:anti-sigma regulatory factor (Ser/Thr protein kinase)